MLLFVLAVFAVNFWGYPLDAVNFNTLHFLSKDPFPSFWGLNVVDPSTKQVDFSFLRRNEGLMAVVLYAFYCLPESLPKKLVLVNTINILVQLLNVALFVTILNKLVGGARILPYLFLYLLYPFAAANHYWGADLPVNLAATLFLFSLALFLRIDYAPDRVTRNVLLWGLPSLVCLWLSIIMVEYAICLSPLYLYLALYYSNGKSAVLKFPRLVTPYTLLASLFLLTSLLPMLLFTGHRLTVASYASRYGELAGQLHLPVSLVALAVMTGNGILVALSYLFANTLGIVLYPLAMVVEHSDHLLLWRGLSLAAVLLGVMGGWMIWLAGQQSRPEARDVPDPRFVIALGLLWAALSYFPFLLSIGYPRNVGLLVDRINVLGSMGVVLCLGTIAQLVQDRARSSRISRRAALAAAGGALAVILLLNLQLQKAYYTEGEQKERALVSAVLDHRDRWREEGREPVFLLDRSLKEAFPRAQLQRSVSEPGGGKLAKVGAFVLKRYFSGITSSTAFNFGEIYLFSCCPSAAPVTFNFYSDWAGRPRPVVYKREEPFRLTEEDDRYILGYASTEVWNDPSHEGTFQAYPKQSHALVVMEIGEPTFHLGGPLTYTFKAYEATKVVDAPARGGA